MTAREQMKKIMQMGICGSFTMEGYDIHSWAKRTYSGIVDNPNISQEIKDSWLEMCVTTADVNQLTNC